MTQSELCEEMIRILDELAMGRVMPVIEGMGKRQKLTYDALTILHHRDSIAETGGRYVITPDGRDYRLELKAPRVYWVKKNWSRVGAGLVTIVVTAALTAVITWLITTRLS